MLLNSRNVIAFSVAVFGLLLPALGEAGGNTGLAINGSGRIDLVTSTPISYLNRGVADGRRTLQLRVAQPVLCADFATPPGGAVNPVGFQIIDPNGDSSGLLFGGITNYDYLTNGASPSLFQVTSGTNLACCVMLPASNASCVQGPNGGSIVTNFFANGFEALTAMPEGGAADVRVQLTGPAFVAPGGSFAYTVNVANVGGTSASAVRVREFHPKSSGGFPAPLQGGNWTCSASGGASCGTASGAGQVVLDNVSLPAGGSVAIAITRTMAPGATNGAQFSVSAAAFAPPAAAESVLINNQAALTATVQTNQSPVISDIPNQNGNEDTAVGPIAFSASDGDNVLTTASLSCASSNTTLIDAAGCTFAGSEPNFTLTLTPKANASGSATLTVTVTDGTSSANDTFSYTVAAVNDAPVNTVPGAQSNDGVAPLVFSTALGRAISVADVDAGSGLLSMTFSTGAAGNGTLTLANPGGVLSSLSGNGSATVTATGTLTALNTALNGASGSLTYTPVAGTNAVRTITVTTNDQGNTGSGGAQTDVDTINITVDSRPTVSSTPANGVTTGNAPTLTINFSEPVNVTAGMTLTCGGGNLLTGGTTGNNVSSLSPTYTAPLPSGACTLTVPAGSVSDVDGTPSNPASNYVATFTIDSPPTVSSTPANGAQVLNNVAITVSFSEAVNVTAGITLTCGGGNLLTGGTTGSGVTSLNLQYTAPLPAGQCTLTVPAGSVSDVDTFDPPDQPTASHLAQFTVVSPPVLADIPDQPGGIEDQVTGPIAFTANDPDSVLTPTSFTCSSSNTALIDTAGCVIGGSEPNFTLTLTPKANANGSANLTISLSDGVYNVQDTVVYTVAAVNDAPDFTVASNRVYAPGTSGIRTVSDFLTALVPGGGPDESGQTVEFVSISLQPGSAAIFGTGGEPSYDEGKNVLAFSLNGTSGVATVRVRVEDNGGTSNGGVNFRERDFTITVQVPSN
jgi:hypothetical protein